jgi:hypothetical protein
MANFWEDILGGGTTLLGYSKLMDRLDENRSDTADSISSMQNQIGGMTKFQPWTVRSNLGTSTYNNGVLEQKLGDSQWNQWNQQRLGATDMFNRVTQDPAMREQDIYNRIRSMQMPEEERAYNSMNANLFGSGRGGMTTAGYGGSPEQFAFGKAQAEARNAASLSAMNQAQQEMQNYGKLGTQMFQNQYLPWDKQAAQAGLGTNLAQLGQRGDLEGANLWAQLGLGGMTADTNYSNIQGNAYGNAIKGLAGMAGGVGGDIDSAGGLWDWIKDLF